MHIPVTLPPGYEPVPGTDRWGFALGEAAPWAREILLAGGTLHGWAAAQPDAGAMTGRGRVYSVRAPAGGPDRRARWVVRHYFRGGLVARWLTDRYVAGGVPRPIREAEASTAARARGIPTPAVVAGAVYPSGIFYRADIVTEQIPSASDLADVLFGDNPVGFEAEAALSAAGRLVRTLEREGLLHADLNAKNIVIHGEAEGPSAFLVDLDQCCARGIGVPAPALPMRRRLVRSLRKFERRMERYLHHGAWAALHRGFEDT